MIKKGVAIFLIIGFLCLGLTCLSLDLSSAILFLEPAFFILISSSLFAICFYEQKSLVSIFIFEFILIAYTIYLIILLAVLPVLNINEGFKILSIIILFYGFKLFNKIFKEKYFELLIIAFSVEGLYFLIVFSYSLFSSDNVNRVHYFPNKSIFGILLTTQISFVLPMLFKRRDLRNGISKKLYWFIVTIIVSNFILLILTNSRAAWLGLIVAFAIILLLLNWIKISKKISYSLAAVFIISITAALFFYKKDSSDGRLFIYKTTLSIADKWFAGIGSDQFQNTYNLYQAKYFSDHNINGKEAYLADNTNYAFNDYLQIFIEQGAIGLLFFLFLIYLTIGNVITSFERRKNDLLFLGAIAALSAVMVTALFSYPMEIIPIMIYFPLCLSIINNTENEKPIFTFPIKPLKIMGFVMAIIFITHSSLLLLYRLKTKEAFNLIQAGYIQKALKVHENLERFYYISEGSTLYQYAELLKNSNQLEKAWKETEKTKRYLTSPKVYKLAASIAEEIGNYSEAEKNYLTAVYITPNRIVARYELLNFYLKSHQKEKAISWANSIMTMPIKVHSQTTTTIKNEVSAILDTLHH
jgi:O-antigen ligase